MSEASLGLQALLGNEEMRVKSARLAPLAFLGSGARLDRPGNQEHEANLDRLVSAAIAANLGQ